MIELPAGMELRDYFAAKAMQALLRNIDMSHESSVVRVCIEAYFVADVMMKARRPKKEQPDV
jgi:hypothetical protein